MLFRSKGTYGNVQAMDMPIPVHRAQAMCYGLIWGEKEGISEINIQMTYAHLETEETPSNGNFAIAWRVLFARS